jgi:hypothetical protein
MQPKPGFGIGNQNKGPILVHIGIGAETSFSKTETFFFHEFSNF